MQELVSAAVAGYHATVLAYGHTGSGKTHTMEGFKYRTGGGHHTGSEQRTAQTAQSEAAAQPSHCTSPSAPPWADFHGTPEQQLGLVPRAVTALFAALKHSSSSSSSTAPRVYRVHVSFVQLYKETAYDLLNPGGSGKLCAGSASARLKPPPMLVGGKGVSTSRNERNSSSWAGAPTAPLRMRWSKSEEFYLENLFKASVAWCPRCVRCGY
jgi:hypothetical protein